MLDLILVKKVALSFLSTLVSLILVGLAKSFFTKALTKGDLFIAISLLVTFPLFTFVKSYFMIDPQSWTAFLVGPAIAVFISALLTLFVNQIRAKSNDKYAR